MTDYGTIGAVGKVLVAIRGSKGSGEVMLTIGGVRECYIADSDTPIERGQTVMVVEVAPHRHVTVVPWADFPLPQ
jgi:membrane-bound ClpP family serine protease